MLPGFVATVSMPLPVKGRSWAAFFGSLVESNIRRIDLTNVRLADDPCSALHQQSEVIGNISRL